MGVAERRSCGMGAHRARTGDAKTWSGGVAEQEGRGRGSCSEHGIREGEGTVAGLRRTAEAGGVMVGK